MNAFYGFVSGPLVWAAFAVFIGGLVFRFWTMARLARKKDVWVYEYWSWKHALNSMLHWFVPFASTNSRRQPVMTVVTFCFHISLIVAPIFLLAHVTLLDESRLGWNWPTLPEAATDVMAFIVVVGACYFMGRRLFKPEVRYVTSCSDFVILAIVVGPFVTGILAYHQVGDPLLWTSLHILFGEIWLAVIPFTRLAHMLWGPFVRGYTGSEFGAVRGVKDW